MIVTFTPESGDPHRWDWDPKKVSVEAAELVEYAFKGTWDEFVLAVMKGGARARKVLLWHLQCRQHPSLRFDDVPSFNVGDLKLEFDRTELLEMRVKVTSAAVDAATRAATLEWIDAELAKLPGAEDGTGKASRSPRGGKATPSKSPTT